MQVLPQFQMSGLLFVIRLLREKRTSETMRPLRASTLKKERPKIVTANNPAELAQ